MNRDFSVTSIFKSNAELKNIVADLGNLTRKFGKADCIFIIGGTNDVRKRGINITGIISTIKNILTTCINTNVIISSIPYAYDDETYNSDIYYINQYIYDLVTLYENSKLLDINFYLNRQGYTRHGLHFSDGGRRVLCEKMMSYVSELSNCGANAGVVPSAVTSGTVEKSVSASIRESSDHMVLDSGINIQHRSVQIEDESVFSGMTVEDDMNVGEANISTKNHNSDQTDYSFPNQNFLETTPLTFTSTK